MKKLDIVGLILTSLGAFFCGVGVVRLYVNADAFAYFCMASGDFLIAIFWIRSIIKTIKAKKSKQ